MNRLLQIKSNTLFWVVGLFVYIIYHLSTLNISPLVWQDETFYNDITLDYLKNHTFFTNADPLFIGGKQCYFYGPVFFMLNSVVIGVFGNTIFTGRILGLMFGFIMLALIYFKYLKGRFDLRFLSVVIFLALCLDPFINMAFHRGRADTIQMTFYLLSFFLVATNKNDGKVNKGYFIISALLYSLCLLTSLRMAIFVIPFSVYFLVEFIKANKEHKKQIAILATSWCAIVFIVFSFWVYSKLGGYHEYLAYIKSINSYFPQLVFGNFNVPFEVKLITFVTILTIVLLVVFSRSCFKNSSVVFYITYFFCFHLLVGDVGPYSILVLPILYCLFLELILQQNFDKGFIRFFKPMVVFVLIFNFLIFVLKVSVLSLTYNQKDYSKVNSFVSKNIPPNSRVVGDELYYYAVLSNNCKYQYVHLQIFDYYKIEEYRRNNFDYDYLILSDRLNSGYSVNFYDLYSKNSKLVKVAEYHSKRSMLLKYLSEFKIYPLAETAYDGVIYKRIN
jgi:hypothetical protein